MFDDRDVRFDLFSLGLLALTVFLALSLLTYSPADSLGDAVFPFNLIYTPHQVEYPLNETLSNACGHAGATCADILLRTFGVAAYFVVACLGIVSTLLLTRRPIEGASVRLIGWLAALVGVVTFIQMFLPHLNVGPAIGPGGIIGAMGRSFLETHFATAGSLILLSCLLIGGVMLCTDYVLLHWATMVVVALINFAPRVRRALVASAVGFLPRRRLGQLNDEEYVDEYDEDLEEEDEERLVRKRRLTNDLGYIGDVLESEPDKEEFEDESDEVDEEAEVDEYEYEEYDEKESDQDRDVDVVAKGAGDASSNPKLRKDKSSGSEREQVIAQLEEASREYDPQDYELPPRTLLKIAENYDPTNLTQEVQRKARLLEKTFEDFKLDVKVVDIETGPVIAQYEVALKRGLRLAKITGLADDLAIALRVPSVRIVAPIPGKNTVGIEVPNDERQIVRMREVMEETNGRVRKMALPIYLGKDASGNPMAVDLAAMPHLLIAGRTGTGKSVCLNSIISSMLMTKTPDDVRMLMIDPKMVELSGYARLPHLMHPVVTDMRKAEAILAWACDKMDERYRLLASAGVRHLSSYNQLGEDELMRRLQPETEDEKKLIPCHLPYIVIIADEMADLMMTAGKEVEAHIIRLASKSRAVGIHLILATQRPTANVITGLIKSNLPARIAFQVASGLDSRVVLDENGADRLLGYGDMLFLSPGTSTLIRGQGTFTADEEIDRIVDYCSSKGEQQFVRELVQLKVEDKDENGEAIQIKKRDDLYEQAVEIVVREGRGSVSLLQRSLQIGYGRAARLIDYMAEDGIVGAYNGNSAREVLMSLSDWEATKAAAEDGEPVVKTQLPLPFVADKASSNSEPAPAIVRTKIATAVAPSPSIDQEWEDDEDVVEEDAYEDDEELADDDGYVDAAFEEDEEEGGDDEYEDEEQAEFEDVELEDDELEDDELEDELEDEFEEDVEDELDEEAELEDEPAIDADAYEDDEEWEDVEDEFAGDEFEQDNYDSEEFKQAVAAVDEKADDTQQVADDYSEEIQEAKQSVLPKAKRSSKRRKSAIQEIPTKHDPRKRGGKKIHAHKPHAK